MFPEDQAAFRKARAGWVPVGYQKLDPPQRLKEALEFEVLMGKYEQSKLVALLVWGQYSFEYLRLRKGGLNKEEETMFVNCLVKLGDRIADL